MQKKKLKKRKFKIASLLFMFVAAVMMLCTMLSTNVYAATTTTSQDSYVPEDPTIYNMKWERGYSLRRIGKMKFDKIRINNNIRLSNKKMEKNIKQLIVVLEILDYREGLNKGNKKPLNKN